MVKIKQTIPQPSGGMIKQTITVANVSSDQYKPTFSLIHLQSQYCLSRCEKDDKANFAETLRKLSQLTWKEIGKSPRHKLGYEHIDRKAIKTSIPLHISEDATLLAFRFSGLKAMVGYREGGLFHVLWLDRDFSLYDHE